VTDIQNLLNGAIDLHVHPSPSPFPRRLSIVQAALSAQQAGFRAIVVKSHHHSMVTDVLALEDCALNELKIDVYAGIALNNHVGGLNPWAVDLCLKLGGKIVWFPTISSQKHIHEHAEGLNFPSLSFRLMPETPIDIVDTNGDILPEVSTILELIKTHDAIAASGHLDAEQVYKLIEHAHGMGVKKVLVNHPNYVIGATPEQCREFAQLGAFIEHSLCMYDDRSTFYQWDISTLLSYIKTVGVDRTILSSDLGQNNNPLPVEAYERIIGMLLQAGLKEAEIKTMITTNPAKLLYGE
jgi:hypothetical protein